MLAKSSRLTSTTADGNDSMDLDAYLDRIGFAGIADPNLAGSTEVHRLQAFKIPYDGLDMDVAAPSRSCGGSGEHSFGLAFGRERGV